MAKATKPRKRPGQKRSRQTVEAIVEAAARILTEEGYGCLTTNKVADLAGVSIGSLYQYFENKESLVYAVYERHQQRVREVMVGEFDVSINLAKYEGIRQLITAVIRAHTVEPQLHARFHSLRQDDSFPIVLGESELGHIANKLEEMLNRLDSINIKDTKLSAWLLVTTVHALIHAFEHSELPCGNDQKADEIARMVFGYIATTNLNLDEASLIE